HGLRACPLPRRGDLDRGKIHLRQGSDRQKRIGDQPHERQRRHHQRGGDRSSDEWFGDVHELPADPAIGGAVYVTVALRWSLYCPSVTMRSPPARPQVPIVRWSYLGPVAIGRGSATSLLLTVQMKRPSGPRWPAAEGTTTALLRVSSNTRALTNSPGHSLSSSLGNIALSRIVAVVWSMVLSTSSSVPVASACRLS